MAEMADKDIQILEQAKIQQAGRQQNHLKMEVQRIQVFQSRSLGGQIRNQVSQIQNQVGQTQIQKVFSCLLG